MPSGLLAAADIEAGVNTLIYQAPGGRAFNVNIRICNRNSFDVHIRLAVTAGDLEDLKVADYNEYDTILRANGNIERTGVSLAQNQSVVGYSDTGNVSFQVGSAYP